MFRSEKSFSKQWEASNPAQKLGLLENIKKQFESKDFKQFDEITSRYGDLLDHDNPNIAQVGLDLLELSVKSFGWIEELKSITIVSTLLTQTLQRKERKAQATELLLFLAEASQKTLQNAIQVSLNSKFPKQLLEVLRFLQILIINNDEHKKQMLKDLSHEIFSVAAEFSLASVRQAALDLIIKMASDLGVDFIRPNLPLLKKTQRVQIAKRLNESGIADGEIDSFEQQKAYMLKCHQEQQKIKQLSQENQVNTNGTYTLSYKVAAQNINIKNEQEKIVSKYTSSLDEQTQKQHKLPPNAVFFVEQLQETTGKDKITLISQIHYRFKSHSNNSPIEYWQLMQYWEFAKYLQFANPQAQEQLMEILEEYIKIMDESAEKKLYLWSVLSGQMKQIVTQIIRNLAISQRYLSAKSQELTISLLNDIRWREAVLESFSQELLSKSEGILLAVLRLLSSTLFTKDIDRNILNLPMAKQIMEKIVGLVTSACESVRKLAFSTLITAAVPMGKDIFVFADRLPVTQLNRFQEQITNVLEGKISGEEGIDGDQQDGKSSKELNSRIEEIKLKICHGNIINQEQLVQELSRTLEDEEERKSSEIGEQQSDTVMILTSLIETGGENIANNAMKLCGILSSKMSQSNRFLVFQQIFRSYEVLRQKEAIQNMNVLFHKIDGDTVLSYLLNQITQRVYENTAFIFITQVLENLDGQNNLAFAVQAVRILITESSIPTKVLATDFLAKTWLSKGKDMIDQAVGQQIQEEMQRDMIVSKIERSYKKYYFLEKIKKNQQNLPDESKAELEGIRQQEIQEGLNRGSQQQQQSISFKEFKMDNKKLIDQSKYEQNEKDDNENDNYDGEQFAAEQDKNNEEKEKDQEDEDEI